jgi:hypothetical protein
LRVVHELLTVATHPLGAVRPLLQRLDRVLLHEGVDPNVARHGLLASIERRTHRLHPMVAAA